MSANANGTPTSLLIPTLAVTDPLTKDGVNEITQAVDAKIAARMFAPATPLDKQVAKYQTSSGLWIAGNVQPSEIGQEGATSAQAMVWSSGLGKWVAGNPPGTIYTYNELTTSVSTITGTTFAGATAIVASTAKTYDGSTAVWMEFYSEGVSNSGAGNKVFFEISDGGTSLGLIGLKTCAVATAGDAILVRRKLTPTAGSHTFTIAAYVSAGTGTVNAGLGGASVVLPAYLSVTQA